MSDNALTGEGQAKRKLSAKTQIVRLIVLLGVGVAIIAGAKYGVEEWEGRDMVSRRVQDAKFQNTHSGNRSGVFCGEVSGINGFGMRTPYVRFVATMERVDTAPFTLSQEKVDAFDHEWRTECEAG